MNKHRRASPFSLPLWAFLAATLYFASGCSTTDPEYMTHLAAARTDWTGEEIVGIWVGKYNYGEGVARATLLLRPDGTGKMIQKAGFLGVHREVDMTYHYSGLGAWTASMGDAGNVVTTFHYTGKNLLCEMRILDPFKDKVMRIVFVRADDSAEVDEYLRKRR